ncbi:MAG: PAS domain-containing protein [Asgard group archaeon]|nr:PAS domain-containing protein [Asgard group archaeon]
MTSAETYFAPPERLANGDVYVQTIKILGLRKVLPVLDILPNMVAILNKHRQVIYANHAFTKAIGVEHFEDGLGQRPGELLACVHSHDTANGCGTGKQCRYCGAVLTVLKTQETDKREESLATITIEREGKKYRLDLHVIASPLIVDEEKFYIVVITDVAK